MRVSAACWSGTQCSALNETTASNSSRKSMVSTSPTAKRSRGDASDAAAAIIRGEGSMPRIEPSRQLVGDGGGDPAVAAADVEDALVAGHRDAGQRLAGQPRLQRADLAVGRPVPVGHGPIVGHGTRYG